MSTLNSHQRHVCACIVASWRRGQIGRQECYDRLDRYFDLLEWRAWVHGTA